MSAEARVQSVLMDTRFDMAAPSPTGFATQVRLLVSMTQPPFGAASRNDEKYGMSAFSHPVPP